MAFVLNAACGSNIGRLRTNNEDNCCFHGETLPEENSGIRTPWRRRFREGAVCFGVFDGMGGEDDGQTASFFAAQSFAFHCRQIDAGEPLSELFFLRAISDMNSAVYSEADRRRNNMGTTAVLMGFSNDTVFVCNVGDSRAYRLRDGQLTQISMDHVALSSPFAPGGPSRKAGLSQCIGISPEELELEAYFAQGSLCEGDRYLLCSDGLTDTVPADVIRALLTENTDVSEAVRQLIDHALDRGGRDNITALLIHAAMVKAP